MIDYVCQSCSFCFICTSEITLAKVVVIVKVVNYFCGSYGYSYNYLTVGVVKK